MLILKTSLEKIEHIKTEAYAFLLEQGATFPQEVRTLSEKCGIPLDHTIKAEGFTGQAGKQIVLTGFNKEQDCLVYLILLGAGEKNKATVEQYRRALGYLIRIAEKHRLKTVSFLFPDAQHYGVLPEYLARETAIVLELSSYHFDRFITDASKKHILPAITVIADKEDIGAVDAGIKAGICIGEAANFSRHLIDMPPHHMNPQILADIVVQTGKEYGLTTTIFDQKECIKMGMGGIEAVSQGSQHDGFLTILEYKSSQLNAPTIALVGKGVTFDSGGLSIKPANSMETMKDDMSGAAAVIATMRVIAQLKPAINVIGLAPLVENMPSGTAIRPGDIITFYNGKTAEIKNTDAEGRLILADALSYATKNYKLDAIVDIATLTGACAYALGGYYAALMGKDRSLLTSIEHAADISGERVWELPFDDDYKAAISSNVADICNIGSPKYMAGTITAGFFLHNFVGTTPWAHLDIAGVAFNVPDISYYRSGAGATGFGVRLFTDLVLNWKVS